MSQDRVEIPDLSLGVKFEIVFGHFEKHFYIPKEWYFSMSAFQVREVLLSPISMGINSIFPNCFRVQAILSSSSVRRGFYPQVQVVESDPFHAI
jgi:hypothetical protein